jgi:enoyl-CoA hydratase
MTSFTNIHIEIAERIATLTVDRPLVRNAIDRATAFEMMQGLETLEQHDVGVLIVTGAGDRAFVSGADLHQMLGRRQRDALAATSAAVFSRIEQCPVPVIAAINGHAVGGGCELALACDFRIAAEHVTFGQPEVGLGLVPAAGAAQRLPRIVGLGRAKHLILTGESIDAQTALSWGLVSSVVPRDALMGAAHALAVRLLTRGRLAMRLAKLSLNASSGGVDPASVIEALAQAICMESEDKVEGIRAFLEKRPPRFGT